LAELALAGRLVAAAVICGFALDKLLTLEATAITMWRPRVVPLARMRFAVVVLAMGELALGSATALMLGPRWLLLCAVSAAGIALTAAGLQSIATTGRCSCQKDAPSTDRSALIRRNAVLFGTLAVGVALGPTLHEMQTAHGAQLAAAGVAAGTVALLAAAVGAADRALMRQESRDSS
jgi:hypothetical protein